MAKVPLKDLSNARILVSNDDGIYSPGIAALAEVASEFGTVRVVAPDVERAETAEAQSPEAQAPEAQSSEETRS